ncbi:hypothetical protein JD507_00460 [Aeromonas jandaei]|uniref:hypothetical protein n=1 Tax=Aeromonas jandaei TaxID=650 RepID=UPI00191CDB98|nr:hypothetical protein [Aeromonas jandaei]MBL0543700.1 hypothetical protein [Aeromonas jandaei]
MDYAKQLEEAKSYIINKINESDYPEDHPFLDKNFKYDFHCHLLALFLLLGKGKLIIDDLIEKKLSGKVSGKFDFNSFHEGLGEFNVLYYMFHGLMISNFQQQFQLTDLYYEPKALVNGKVLEYIFKTKCRDLEYYIFTEVKTISTAPEYREDFQIKPGNKFVKPYFPNISIDSLKQRKDYDELIILKQSTHARQVAKNIKKINEKFKKQPNIINIGVLIFQYATSFDEMYAYLFHPSLGIYTRNPSHFENIDALVIFSMTQTPDYTLNELYEKEHVQTICLTDASWKIDMLRVLRFDNYMFRDGCVVEPLKPFTTEEFGVFNYILEHGLLFFINERDDRKSAIALAKNISSKLNNLVKNNQPN